MGNLKEPLIEETGSFVGVRFHRKDAEVTNGKSEDGNSYFSTDSDRLDIEEIFAK